MKHPNIRQGVFFFHLLLAITLCGLSCQARAQKIDRLKPGIYLTFKALVKPRRNVRQDSISLVLHNNTRWPIYYIRHYDPSFPDVDSIAYVIELKNGCIDARKYVDVVTTSRLLPGKVTTLMVPREDFQKNSQIYIEFYYSWEAGRYGTLRYETEHRAYFGSYDLPTELRP